MAALTRSAVAALIVLAGIPARAAQAPKEPPYSDLIVELDQVATQVRSAEDRLKLVETQYSQREVSDQELLNRRYSDGEIQYLLGNFTGSMVLFYDLVGDPNFKNNSHYSEALFYLAEGLYQQQNYSSARVYLRQLLALKSAHYRVELARYLEIASRLNDFSEVDEYIEKARSPNGELAPELAYLYGKWLFKRGDLTAAERAKRITPVLKPLSEDPQGRFRLQSAYLLAVGEVQKGDLDAAAKAFLVINQSVSRDSQEAKIKELAALSLGRVLYEMGKLDQAIDRYQDVPAHSDYFPQSLYEVAWARTKKGEYLLAKNTVDILLLASPDSTLTPDAQLLQGHLLLKLGRYDDAKEPYQRVSETYGPVRDKIDSLLTVSSDPVAYFDSLLAKSERSFDINSLLPPIAVKWANSHQEVAEATRMVNDLEVSQRGASDASSLAERLLKSIEARGATIFPALQEGASRAEGVSASLAFIEERLVSIEARLVDNVLTPDERDQLTRLRSAHMALAKRVSAIPTSEQGIHDRRARMLASLEREETELFQLNYQIERMRAEAAAINKWLQDTSSERGAGTQESRTFAQKVKAELESASELQKQLEQLKQTLAEERASVDAPVGGEDDLRGRWRAALQKEHQLLAAAAPRVSAAAAALLGQINTLRTRVAEMEPRLATAQRNITQQVAARAKQIREKISTEQASIATYRQDMGAASKDASQVVGRIAYHNFRRLRPQFEELLLKADVGMLDIGFTRKQNKTAEIQKLSFQKDRDLQALELDFKDIIKDAD